jgi:hypothetical protein
MMRRLWLVAAATLALPAPALADKGRRADLEIGLTSRSPGAPTGFSLHAALHAEGDPDAKPPPIRSAVFRLPDGVRLDTTAVPQCTASDDELRLFGSSACPADSELTVGRLTADTGFGPPVDPIAGDDHVFNGKGQIIEVITAPGTPLSPGFDRLTISGSTLTAHPPTTPGGPPDGETAIRSIDFAIPVRGSLITAPPACPADGRWTSSATVGFADGTSETVGSATACTPRSAERRRHPHAARGPGARRGR